MEVLMLLTVALAAALAGWLVIPAQQPRRSVSPDGHGDARVRTILVRLGDTTLVEALLSVSALGDACDLIAGSVRVGGLLLGRSEACALVIVLAVASGLVGVVVSSSPVGVPVGLVLFAAALASWVATRTRARRRELAQEMPQVFRSLANAMAAGRTLSQAVSYVGCHERGPAADEFAQASLRLMCGTSAKDSLSELASRLDAPGMGLLSCALLVSQRTGSPLGELFLRSARLVERQGEFEQSLSVKTAQVRLSVRIVCMLPVAMVCLLALLSPDFRQGLSTPVGAGSLVVAALLDACALVLVRRIMRGVI